MNMTLEGMSELREQLTTVSRRTARKYLEACAQPAAAVVIDAADETVPVETGTLKNNLIAETEFVRGETSTITRIGPRAGIKWGSIQEFGSHNQVAQHWLERAFESCKDRVLSVFATELTALLMDLEDTGRKSR